MIELEVPLFEDVDDGLPFLVLIVEIHEGNLALPVPFAGAGVAHGSGEPKFGGFRVAEFLGEESGLEDGVGFDLLVIRVS